MEEKQVTIVRDNLNKRKQEQSLSNDEFFKDFPPGYRFDPNEAELVTHYLLPKINGHELPPNLMHDQNIYQDRPDKLAAKYKPQGDNAWYFFTTRDRKYPCGTRPDRSVAEGGYWKATGVDKCVKLNGDDEDNVKAYKRSLVFYDGKQNEESSKTCWLMQEYFIKDPSKQKKLLNINKENKKRKANEEIDMKLDGVVLCKVYINKRAKTTSTPDGLDVADFNNDHNNKLVDFDAAGFNNYWVNSDIANMNNNNIGMNSYYDNNNNNNNNIINNVVNNIGRNSYYYNNNNIINNVVNNNICRNSYYDNNNNIINNVVKNNICRNSYYDNNNNIINNVVNNNIGRNSYYDDDNNNIGGSSYYDSYKVDNCSNNVQGNNIYGNLAIQNDVELPPFSSYQYNPILTEPNMDDTNDLLSSLQDNSSLIFSASLPTDQQQFINCSNNIMFTSTPPTTSDHFSPTS